MLGDGAFLDALPVDARAQVLTGAHRRRFNRREVLFHQGDPGDSLHILDRGWVAVRVTTVLGDVATLDMLGPGAMFGELALIPISGGRRSASVVAIEASQTIEVAGSVFEELCRSHPETIRQILEMVAWRERRLTQRLVEALYVPVETRLVRRLIDVDRQYDRSHPGPVPIPLTQEDLASLAGTTRETANRVLHRLVEAGAISVGRGSFQVLDHDALRRRAGAGAGSS